MQNIIEAALNAVVEHPFWAVIGFVGLMIVGPPLARLVRAYWAPKVTGWRCWAGRVFQKLGVRLSGGEVAGPPADEIGTTEADETDTTAAAEEVRRLHARL
ncbi:hypothetical protein ACWGFX_38375 [Streptomyces xanthophaeus]